MNTLVGNDVEIVSQAMTGFERGVFPLHILPEQLVENGCHLSSSKRQNQNP
jgi:hypothetical protein